MKEITYSSSGTSVVLKQTTEGAAHFEEKRIIPQLLQLLKARSLIAKELLITNTEEGFKNCSAILWLYNDNIKKLLHIYPFSDGKKYYYVFEKIGFTHRQL